MERCIKVEIAAEKGDGEKESLVYYRGIKELGFYSPAKKLRKGILLAVDKWKVNSRMESIYLSEKIMRTIKSQYKLTIIVFTLEIKRLVLSENRASGIALDTGAVHT